MTLSVIHASRSGVQLFDHDGKACWVWRDDVYRALHNAQFYGDNAAQLTTGIFLTTDELVELTEQMDAAWTGNAS